MIYDIIIKQQTPTPNPPSLFNFFFPTSTQEKNAVSFVVA